MKTFGIVQRAVALLTFGAAALLVACGGGGGGGVSSGPVVTPTGTPNSASSSIVTSSTATSAPVPQVGGISGSVSLPSVTSGAGASISATSSLVVPAGIPALQAAVRAPQDVTTVYLYESFTPNASITFGGIPGFSITLPAGTNMSQVFYVATYAAGWDKAHAEAGTVSGNTVTFAPQSGSFTLSAGTTYYFAFYGVVFSTPTTGPLPPIVLAPSSLSFTAVGSSFSQTTTASESGYTGTFAAASPNCISGTATVATIAAGPSANQFTVTPVAAGSCTVAINDSSLRSTPLSVTVTTTSVGGN